MDSDIIVAVSTAAGAAALGVVRLSGELCHKLAFSMFSTKNLVPPKGYEARYGVISDGNRPVDEAVALFFYAPHSYTGEDVVEFSCHGSEAVLNRVVETAVRLGARRAVAGEFSRRAYLNGKLSLEKAEAVSALISSEGSVSAAAAADALCGGFGKTLSDLQLEICETSALIAASCDFSDDVDFDSNSLLIKLEMISKKLEELYINTENTYVAERGVEAVIFGQPNVGKSTILNLLCGYDRAIVNETAGTTRDVVVQNILLCGTKIILRDTAGLCETEDKIELEGIRRSQCAASYAGLIIAVFDASRAFDTGFLDNFSNKTVVAVLNKIDIGNATQLCELEAVFENTVAIQATNSSARKPLTDAIVKALNTKTVPAGTQMFATMRQADAAKDAFEAIECGIVAIKDGLYDVAGVCIDRAHTYVCDIMCLSPTKEVIERIFKDFCIGK